MDLSPAKSLDWEVLAEIVRGTLQKLIVADKAVIDAKSDAEHPPWLEEDLRAVFDSDHSFELNERRRIAAGLQEDTLHNLLTAAQLRRDALAGLFSAIATPFIEVSEAAGAADRLDPSPLILPQVCTAQEIDPANRFLVRFIVRHGPEIPNALLPRLVLRWLMDFETALVNWRTIFVGPPPMPSRDHTPYDRDTGTTTKKFQAWFQSERGRHQAAIESKQLLVDELGQLIVRGCERVMDMAAEAGLPYTTFRQLCETLQKPEARVHVELGWFAPSKGELDTLIRVNRHKARAEDAESPRAAPKPLTGKALAAMEYIKRNPGKIGEVIAVDIGVDFGHFRSRIVPKLKKHGVLNQGEGYYPPSM